MSDAPIPTSADTPLESWKAIAAHLNRDARTVMRWEKFEGLPVHRHRHLTRSSVYAFPTELDAWRANRRVELPEAPPAPRQRAARVLIAAATVAIGVLTAGDGRFEGPISATMQTGPIDRVVPWPDNPGLAAEASISPDGRHVAYIDVASHELHVRDLRAERAWVLTRIAADGGSIMAAAISTDGTSVAFVSDEKDEERPGLRVLPLTATGTTAPRLLVEGSYVAPEEWSQDDQKIVVRVHGAARNDIGIVSVADGSLRVLATLAFPGPGDVITLSPDAAVVAYDAQAEPDHRQRDVYLLPATGGPPTAVITGPSSDEVVGWSPQGRHLVFRSDRSGSRGVGLWALPMANGRPSGAPVLVRPDFRGDVLNMTAQGALFYEHTLRTDELLVASIDPQANGSLGVPQFGAHDREALAARPRWSADGKSFLYVMQRPTGPVIAIRSTTTGIVREIPLDLSYVWTFDWSPDGRLLVFRGVDLRGRTGLHLADAATGDVRPFALWEEGVVRYFVPQFTADSKAVTYIKGDMKGGGGYVQRDIGSGAERVLAEQVGVGNALRRSPDGRLLLGLVNEPAATSIQMFDVTTRQSREVLRVDRPGAVNGEDGAQWMPDGRAVVVNVRGTAENARELWWIPVDGRQSHRIDLGTAPLVDSAFAIHPDGRQIAFLSGRPVPSKTSILDTEFRLLDRFLPVR